MNYLVSLNMPRLKAAEYGDKIIKNAKVTKPDKHSHKISCKNTVTKNPAKTQTQKFKTNAKAKKSEKTSLRNEPKKAKKIILPGSWPEFS